MADRRRCASCSVPRPAGTSRCPSCGHVEGDPVAVASSRSTRPSRRRLMAGALVVAVSAGLVLLATRTSDIDPARTAPARAPAPEPTSTTATATAIGAPPSGLPVSPGGRRPPAGTALAVEPLGEGWPDLGAVRILRWAQSGPGELIDPVGRVVTALQLATPGPIASIVARLDGAVVVAAGRAVFHARLPGSDGVVDLGPADRALASHEPSRVWLVSGTGTLDRIAPVAVREVDVADGRSTAPVALPLDAWPIAGVEGGLLVRGPDGGYVIEGDGRARRVTDGEVVAASGTTALVRACTEELRCGYRLLDLRAGSERSIDLDPELIWWEVHLGPTGTMAAGIGHDGDHGWRLVIEDLATGDRFDHVLDTAGSPPPTASVTWSPDGRWLLMGREDGLRLYRAEDGVETVVEREGSPTAVTVIG